MSTIVKLAALVGVVGTFAACSQPEEEVVIVEPAPVIVAEPIGGKF